MTGERFRAAVAQAIRGARMTRNGHPVAGQLELKRAFARGCIPASVMSSILKDVVMPAPVFGAQAVNALPTRYGRRRAIAINLQAAKFRAIRLRHGQGCSRNSTPGFALLDLYVAGVTSEELHRSGVSAFRQLRTALGAKQPAMPSAPGYAPATLGPEASAFARFAFGPVAGNA